MSLIDRYILWRFLANFALLFVLLYLFATAIDLMHALDKFIEVAASAAGDEAGIVVKTLTFVKLVLDFQSPRFFQFYAYLHGLVAIGAMGFTLAQMYRHRELVAMLSAGLSMQRISMPFVVGAFALSVMQLLNQELFLPRVAPLLLRDHGNIGERSVDDFPILLTADGRGNLLQAPQFDPETHVLSSPTFLERDERGRTRRRVTATGARWASRPGEDGSVDGWELTAGNVVTLTPEESADPSAGSGRRAAIDFVATDLSPEVLLVHRYGQFAAMLNLRQIKQMLETPGVADRDALRRYRYSRFSAVLVNVLVMWLALPTFLVREPVNLLRRTILCAAIAIPALLGAAIFMVMELPGISPAVGVFLPVILLIPIVLARWTYIRT
jgi:lipopolysaccharide export LptBFGC system permease protein LptF